KNPSREADGQPQRFGRQGRGPGRGAGARPSEPREPPTPQDWSATVSPRVFPRWPLPGRRPSQPPASPPAPPPRPSAPPLRWSALRPALPRRDHALPGPRPTGTTPRRDHALPGPRPTGTNRPLDHAADLSPPAKSRPPPTLRPSPGVSLLPPSRPPSPDSHDPFAPPLGSSWSLAGCRRGR